MPGENHGHTPLDNGGVILSSKRWAVALAEQRIDTDSRAATESLVTVDSVGSVLLLLTTLRADSEAQDIAVRRTHSSLMQLSQVKQLASETDSRRCCPAPCTMHNAPCLLWLAVWVDVLQIRRHRHLPWRSPPRRIPHVHYLRPVSGPHHLIVSPAEGHFAGPRGRARCKGNIACSPCIAVIWSRAACYGWRRESLAPPLLRCAHNS